MAPREHLLRMIAEHLQLVQHHAGHHVFTPFTHAHIIVFRLLHM